MTNAELLQIFDVPQENTRWMASVDSAEYLTLVTWLVNRAQREAA